MFTARRTINACHATLLFECLNLKRKLDRSKLTNNVMLEVIVSFDDDLLAQ